MQTYSPNTQRLVTALDAVTATTTSEAIAVAGAKKITLFVERADHSAGSSAFSVSGSVDGVNFVSLNTIVTNVTNTNSQTKVRAASVSLAANGTEVAGVDVDHMAFSHLKVTVTETTDGTHSAKLLIET